MNTAFLTKIFKPTAKVPFYSWMLIEQNNAIMQLGHSPSLLEVRTDIKAMKRKIKDKLNGK